MRPACGRAFWRRSSDRRLPHHDETAFLKMAHDALRGNRGRHAVAEITANPVLICESENGPMLQPPLTPADDAQFFGTIDCVDRGRMFRAACFAQVKNIMTEQPHIRMFASDDDAVKWIDQEARRRRFVEYALSRAAKIRQRALWLVASSPTPRRAGTSQSFAVALARSLRVHDRQFSYDLRERTT